MRLPCRRSRRARPICAVRRWSLPNSRMVPDACSATCNIAARASGAACSTSSGGCAPTVRSSDTAACRAPRPALQASASASTIAAPDAGWRPRSRCACSPSVSMSSSCIASKPMSRSRITPASASSKRSACSARAWHTTASSRKGAGGRRPNTRCSRATTRAWSPLEEIKIFPLLPFGRLVSSIPDAGLVEPTLEAADFVALELEEIVDEHFAKLLAEQRLAFERIERGRQALRQQRLVAPVRLHALRTGIELAGDAIEARDDLRHDEEIRIRRRLADAVFQARRRIANATQRTDHHAAMVVAPGGTVWCERIRPEAAITVHRRRGEGGARRRVLEQPRNEHPPQRRGRLACALWHEQVAPALHIDRRLMQMPAAGIAAFELRPAHEGREVAEPATDLACGRAKQQHRVGGRKRIRSREGAFDLPRPPLILDRAQWQIELRISIAKRREHALHQVHVGL